MAENSNREISCEHDYREIRNAEDNRLVSLDV